MASKRPKLIFQIMLGMFLLSLVTACGGSGDKKETTDSTSVKTDTIPAMPVDTSKMDTATTRPVKEAN
jgi:hypothetical protein